MHIFDSYPLEISLVAICNPAERSLQLRHFVFLDCPYAVNINIGHETMFVQT